MKIIDTCFKMNKRVRYAAVYTRKGRLLAGGMRPGVKSLDPPRQAREIDKATALYTGKVMAMKPYLGRLKSIQISMGKLNIYVLPYGRNILVQTSKSSLPRVIQALQRMS